jgi:hypothetical protein
MKEEGTYEAKVPVYQRYWKHRKDCITQRYWKKTKRLKKVVGKEDMSFMGRIETLLILVMWVLGFCVMIWLVTC